MTSRKDFDELTKNLSHDSKVLLEAWAIQNNLI